MPAEPLRFGLYGCGNRTNALIDSVIGDGLVEVTCCFDIDGEKAHRVAAKYDAQMAQTSQQLIERKDVDAFLISLAPFAHVDACIETLPAGKPIFLEKPVATNLQDAKRLAQAVKCRGEAAKLINVGFIHRYQPVYRRVTEMIQSGRLGQVVASHIHWLSHSPPGPRVEGMELDWRDEPATGGQLMFHYCHCFDLHRLWGGEFKSITATSNHLVYPQSTSENEIFVCAEYESGALAGFHFSEVSRRIDMLGRIEGTQMTIEHEWNEHPVIRLYKTDRQYGPRVADEEIRDIPVDFVNENMVDFIAAARGERPVVSPIEDGLATVVIAEAVRLSAREGRRVELAGLL